jgi:hypothetical protein
MAGKNSHVVPRDDGWAVTKEGAARASKTFERQADAIKYAREQARKDSSELFVHRQDGTIRERSSYGNDPCPPKDKR